MKFITVIGPKTRIEEDLSSFIRRFDCFEYKKEFTVGDIVSVYSKDVSSIVLMGNVFFKDMIRGWIPKEEKVIFKCGRSIKEWKNIQNKA